MDTLIKSFTGQSRSSNERVSSEIRIETSHDCFRTSGFTSGAPLPVKRWRRRVFPMSVQSSEYSRIGRKRIRIKNLYFLIVFEIVPDDS